jgi:hypothetical protein
MAVKATYGDLNKEEQAHWDEYETLREISDWVGFDAAQEERKQDARKWLVDRRKQIWRLAQPKNKGGDGNGWRSNNRRDRHTFLKDDNLNKGAPKHEVRLPAPAVCTNAEKVYIEEREGYLAFGSVNPEQRARKQANVDWLVNRRQQLYRLNKEDPSDGRKRRYDALCIATHHGSAYKEWDKERRRRQTTPAGLASSAGATSTSASRRALPAPTRAIPSRTPGRSASTAASASPGAPASPSARPGMLVSRAVAQPQSS